jgi:uncharacterized membrane protein (UPF0127 family)
MRYHLGKALLKACEGMESDIMRKRREIYFIKLTSTVHCIDIVFIKADNIVLVLLRPWHISSYICLRGGGSTWTP